MIRNFLMLAIRSSVAYRLSQPLPRSGLPVDARMDSAPLPAHA